MQNQSPTNSSANSATGTRIGPTFPPAVEHIRRRLSGSREKEKISELASAAMEELQRLAFAGQPLWHCAEKGLMPRLDRSAYLREFGPLDPLIKEAMKILREGYSGCLIDFNKYIRENSYNRQVMKEIVPENFHTEATRCDSVVKTKPVNIIKLFMDVVRHLSFTRCTKI